MNRSPFRGIAGVSTDTLVPDQAERALDTGGKLTLMALSSTLSSPSPFCCGSIVHPAMIAPEDGENLSAPLGFYPSHDEAKDGVEKIDAAMKAKPFAEKCDYHLYDSV